jgi:hypothetical protein
MKQVVIVLKNGRRIEVSNRYSVKFFADSVLDVTVNHEGCGFFFYECLTLLGSVNNLNNVVTVNSLIKLSQHPKLQTVVLLERLTHELYIVGSKDIARVELV